MALLISGVFGDKVKVFSADDESSVHLSGNNGTSQDTTTDGDETGEWALLVCRSSKSAFWLWQIMMILLAHHNVVDALVALRTECVIPKKYRCRRDSDSRSFPRTNVGSLNGELGCSESQSNILIPSSSSLADSS